MRRDCNSKSKHPRNEDPTNKSAMRLALGCALFGGTLLASTSHVSSVCPLQPAPMASGLDDLLPATVLSVAVAALQQVQQQSRTRTLAQWEVALRSVDDAFEWEDNGDQDGPLVKRTRRVFARTNWKESAWWRQLQEPDLLDHTTDAAKVFRTRFRVPHAFFLKLVELAREKRWFSQGDRDAAGKTGIPIELKVNNPKMCRHERVA